MSKSAGNTINVDETQESLETKIRKTFCSPGDIEVNPILSWYKALILPLSNGPLEFGNLTISDYKALETAWAKKEISPQDFKKSAVPDLRQSAALNRERVGCIPGERFYRFFHK